MKEENAIEVRNLTKKFKAYFDKGSSLKEKILFKNRNRYEIRWVLKGIDFDVKKGEAIGLIGHNGCGKSTTLKLLSKILYPDKGTIELKGRVSSLIELGAGFHPDMSGRENIYTNAAIFGLKKKEIDERIDKIIAFSELEEYIDNPVRTYSSGMYMRLAFSVAINVDADILLIDEILTVGDAHFQEKCFKKLQEIKRQGATIVIVSHSLGQIEEICERTIWLDDGKIKAEGVPAKVHAEYMDFMNVERKSDRLEELRDKKDRETAGAKDRYQQGEARAKQVVIWKESGNPPVSISADQIQKMEISYQVEGYSDHAVSGIEREKDGWLRVYGTELKTMPPSEYSLDMREADYLFYLANITSQAENYLENMCINGRCDRLDGKIVIHQEGTVWGPYIQAAPTPHKLEVKVEIEEGREVLMSITADSGKKLIRQFILRNGTNKFMFKLGYAVENLEFVISNADLQDILLEEILFV